MNTNADGWIVYDDAGIVWGIGATEDAAQDDAERSAALATCSLEWSALRTCCATARLLDAVRVGGGAVRWHSIDTEGRRFADIDA